MLRELGVRGLGLALGLARTPCHLRELLRLRVAQQRLTKGAKRSGRGAPCALRAQAPCACRGPGHALRKKNKPPPSIVPLELAKVLSGAQEAATQGAGQAGQAARGALQDGARGLLSLCCAGLSLARSLALVLLALR